MLVVLQVPLIWDVNAQAQKKLQNSHFKNFLKDNRKVLLKENRKINTNLKHIKQKGNLN